MIQRKFRIQPLEYGQLVDEPAFVSLWLCHAPGEDFPRGYGDRPVTAYLDFLRKNAALDPLLTPP